MVNIDPTAEAVSLNPIQTLKDEPDFVIDFLVQTAGEEVAEGVKAKAKEVALAVAEAKENVNLLNLVEAFDQVPELKAFSVQLRKVALSGSYGGLFIDEYHRLPKEPLPPSLEQLREHFRTKEQ